MRVVCQAESDPICDCASLSRQGGLLTIRIRYCICSTTEYSQFAFSHMYSHPALVWHRPLLHLRWNPSADTVPCKRAGHSSIFQCLLLPHP